MDTVGIRLGAKYVLKSKNFRPWFGAGIGMYKSPELYGAFPTDAYSHTPGNAGVKQPGLTGQVKEDIISRMGELGLRLKNGEIEFNPSLLNPDEILEQRESFEYLDLDGKIRVISLNTGELGFTFCQVPCIYHINDGEKIEIVFKDGLVKSFTGNTLNSEISAGIFARTGSVRQVNIFTERPNSTVK